MNSIYPYQTREVRDLASACFSPPLLHIGQLTGRTTAITACSLQWTPERMAWLERLDRDPSALLQHLSLRPTHRLGVYFEQLWHFFLQQDPATDLVAHNFPVVYEGRTLGEFDCIYYSHQRECHVHLELAVKYYLGKQRTTTLDAKGYAHEWLGPNTGDRLDAKLEQLLQRQILLGENAVARRKLQNLGISELAREVVIKGCLFQPTSASPPPPPAYNVDCALGTWVPLDQLHMYCAALGSTQYMIVPRMKWLSAARCDDSRELLDANQLHMRMMHYFADASSPLLVAVMDSHALEAKRLFVTPQHWPDSMHR